MKKLLTDILSIPSHTGQCDQMAEFIIGHCDKRGMETLVDRRGNLYVTKGKSKTYPCLVAHMDTVHYIEDGGIVPVLINGLVTGFNPITMEQTGIGGDDKCGIYAALRCLDRLPAAKAAFFVDEECGCIGSGDCWLEFFQDCRFVLQADRRGNGDWVHNISGPLGSDEFQKAVAPHLKRHKYQPCTGMMSDVMALRDSKVGISVANMSAGYYNPHEACEFVSIKDLENVTALMLSICQGLKDTYPFVWEAPPRAFRTLFKGWGADLRDEAQRRLQFMELEDKRNPGTGDTFPDYDPEYSGMADECCAGCMEVFPNEDMEETMRGRLCPDCLWVFCEK